MKGEHIYIYICIYACISINTNILATNIRSVSSKPFIFHWIISCLYTTNDYYYLQKAFKKWKKTPTCEEITSNI